MTRSDERRLADMVLGAIVGYFVTRTLAEMERTNTGQQRPATGRTSSR